MSTHDHQKDFACLRALAERHREARKRQDRANTLRDWRALHDLDMRRPMIYVWTILFTAELEELKNIQCEDPFLKNIERRLKIDLYHQSIGDDYLLEPFLSIPAVFPGMEYGGYGVRFESHKSEGGADNRYAAPPLESLADLSMIAPAPYVVDEAATRRRVALVQEALGELMPIWVKRSTPRNAGFPVMLASMRGLQQVMMDMAQNPKGLHRLLGIMAEATWTAIEESEKNGSYGSPDQHIQSCGYSNYTVDPYPLKHVSLKELWCHAHAQEFTLISPAMHKEFALDYQRPIMERFAASSYGCCENITHKIDILREVKNLKRISVTPVSDLQECAKQIGADHVISWRPNPSDHVCLAFDRDRIRRLMTEGCEILDKYNCQYEINLKDVVSIQGERHRIEEWVGIVRDVISRHS